MYRVCKTCGKRFFISVNLPNYAYKALENKKRLYFCGHNCKAEYEKSKSGGASNEGK